MLSGQGAEASTAGKDHVTLPGPAFTATSFTVDNHKSRALHSPHHVPGHTQIHASSLRVTLQGCELRLCPFHRCTEAKEASYLSATTQQTFPEGSLALDQHSPVCGCFPINQCYIRVQITLFSLKSVNVRVTSGHCLGQHRYRVLLPVQEVLLASTSLGAAEGLGTQW